MKNLSKIIFGCLLMMSMTLSVQAFAVNVKSDVKLKKVFINERSGLGRSYLQAGENSIDLEHYPNSVSLMIHKGRGDVLLSRIWVEGPDAKVDISLSQDLAVEVKNPGIKQKDLNLISSEIVTWGIFPYQYQEGRPIEPILALEAKSIIENQIVYTSREVLANYVELAKAHDVSFWATDIINAYLRKPSEYFYSDAQLHLVEAKNGEEEFVKIKPDGTKYWLVAVSGSWCGPCLKGIPDMRKAYDELNEEVKFVSLWNDTDLDTFLNNHKDKKEAIVWTNLWDEYGLVANSMKVQAYPSYMLFDPSGKEIGRWEKLPGDLSKYLPN